MHYKIKRYKLRTRRFVRRFEKRYRDHPRLVPVLAVLSIVSIGIILAITLRDSNVLPADGRENSNIVILHADNETHTIPTRAQTVGDLLTNAQIELREGDIVEPGLDAQIDDDDFRINVYRGLPVVIEDGASRTHAVSAALTPRSVVEQAGRKLYPEDIINAQPSRDFINDGIGAKITIERATPANINLYGTPLMMRTHAGTVGELLDEKNITVGENDEIQPSADTALTPQIQIFVTRAGTEIVSVEEEVPTPVETVLDNNLSFGTMAVRQEGEPGLKSITYQLEMRNGREVGRTLLQEVIVREPVPRIVARGQAVSISSDHEAIMRGAGIAPSDFPYAEFIINHENRLWCPTRWQGQTHCPSYYEEKFPGAETHTSTGYGLCQSTPAIKMQTAGADWRVNVVTQMKWCSGYAIGRYGSWENAYNAWKGRQESGGRGWW